MAQFKNDSLLYLGRGPLDAKSLVQTYAELLDVNTWTKEDTLVAYNGMIVAVWLNKADTSKNGIYFLFDTAVTTKLKKPDVTNEANWHRLASLEDLSDLTVQLANIQSSLAAFDTEIDELQDAATVTVAAKVDLPEEGISGKLYIVVDEATTYIWHNGAYLPVGDGSASEPDIQVIMGGSPIAE
jgi:hypothetical protein